jgi:hypothetical protein
VKKAIIGLLVLAVAGLGGFLLIKREFQKQLLAEVDGLVDKLEFSGPERARVKEMLPSVGKEALEKSLSSFASIRPNMEAFLDELFQGLADKARAQGDEELAEKIEKERGFVSMDTLPQG